MSDEKNWYVLKAVSGQESKVKVYIENEIQYHKLENYVGDILIPIEKIIQIRNGKKIQKDKVHYPGYIMIEADLQGEVPHVIKNVPGVISFLSETKGGTPVPMRESEVKRMLGKMDELEDSVDLINIPYTVGETVKVIDGPFNGFNGSIEEVNEDKRKIKVMVLIFGRKTPLELNYIQVQKV